MRLGVLLGVLAVLGCTPDDEPGPDGGGPVPIEGYCEAIVGGLCEWQSACGCEVDEPCPEAVARCEAFMDELNVAVAEGRTRYDGARTRELANRIAAASCGEDTFSALGYGLADFLDFGGVFKGTLAPGSTCTFGNQVSDDVSDGLGLSVECERGICKDGTCLELRDVGDACDETMRCFDFSIERWDPDSPPRLSCDGTCQPMLELGAPCTTGAECASHWCDGAEGATACTVRPDTSGHLAAGAPCTDRFECESMACEGGVCVAPACSPDVE